MPVLHFTDAEARDLPAPPTRIDYFDDVVTGLCLRVTPRGHKSWSVKYRIGRRVRRLTFNGFPTLLVADARKAARDALREVAQGKDPASAKRTAIEALTFGQLAERYIERYAKPHKRSWRADARQLRVFCRRPWGHDSRGRSVPRQYPRPAGRHRGRALGRHRQSFAIVLGQTLLLGDGRGLS
jgi:hypothetical protein